MNEQQIKWDDLAIVPLPLEPASLQKENWIEPDVHLGDATLEKWMMNKNTAYKLELHAGHAVSGTPRGGYHICPAISVMP